MTDPDAIQNQWKEQPMAAHSYDAKELAARARAFDATIRRRNQFEILAGAVVVVFGVVAGTLSMLGGIETPDQGIRALGLFALSIGAAFVTWQMLVRAGARTTVSGAVPSSQSFRAELIRQRDALRSVWLWYVLPMMPGFLLIYGADIFAPNASVWLSAGLLGATVLVAGIVVWMNEVAARAIDAEIAALGTDG